MPLLADEPPGLLPLQPPPLTSRAAAVVLVIARPRLASAGRGAGRDGEQERRGKQGDEQGAARPPRAPAAAAGQPAPVRRGQRPPTLPRVQAPPVKARAPRRQRLTAGAGPASLVVGRQLVAH
jgi:hypothetical protein